LSIQLRRDLNAADDFSYNSIEMNNGQLTADVTAASTPESRGNRAAPRPNADFGPTDTFARRHIGPSEAEVREMLALLGLGTLDELAEQTVPASIRLNSPLRLSGIDNESRTPAGEFECLQRLKEIAAKNKVFRRSRRDGSRRSSTSRRWSAT
jgi:hypothetical protein